MKIAQLLVVVETQFFWDGHFEFFFASFLLKLVPICGVPRIFLNFDDYPDVQQKAIMETLYNLLKNKTEKGCAMDDKSHSFMPPDDCLTTVNCQTQKLYNN